MKTKYSNLKINVMKNDINENKALSQASVSSSASKCFQFLFDKYTLSEEEQNWCREFEMSSGLEPIFTNEVTDQRSFIDMAKQNNQHVMDSADEVISRSESVIWKLSYYDAVHYC